MQITANVYWCKFDKLVDKYRPDQGKEYAVEAANLSKETKMALKKAGVLGRVKNKMDDREDFIHFSVSEYQRPRKYRDDGGYDLWDFDDGSLQDALDQGYTAKKNDEVPFFKADGKTRWDFKKDGLIGNGSVADFKFNTNGPNVYLVAVRILEHKKYEGANTDNEDPNDWGDVPVKINTTDFNKDFGLGPKGDLDDDVPL